MSVPAIVIAAPASGSGKTTLATGLIGALRRAGHEVAPFKVGPDYIDPGYHGLAAGRPGRNLDPVLVGADRVAPLYRHGSRGSDIAVVEGVMGLFDGRIDADFPGPVAEGSTAQVAAALGAPVLLVVDARGHSQSLAALLHGFATFSTDIRLGGVILNRVGSARHEEVLRAACDRVGLPVLGALPRMSELSVPSRHLGLIPAVEHGSAARSAVDVMTELVAAHIDLAAVVALAASRVTGPAWDPVAEVGSEIAFDHKDIAGQWDRAAVVPPGDDPRAHHGLPNTGSGSSDADRSEGRPYPIHAAARAVPTDAESAITRPGSTAPGSGGAGAGPGVGAGAGPGAGAKDRTSVLASANAGPDAAGRERVPAGAGPDATGRERVPAGAGPDATGRERVPAGAGPDATGRERIPAGAGPDRTSMRRAPVIAVAGGAAFTFGYAEHRELLSAAGAEVVVFDPLRDELPTGTVGLVLPGGFPEEHAAELAANEPLLTAVAAAARRGLPIHAECAGLLYLTRTLDGHRMAGVIDAAAEFGPRLTLGYRDAVALSDSVLWAAGSRVRGHEFHRTRLVDIAPGAPAWGWRTPDGSAAREGSMVHRVHASYLHTHPAGNPTAIARFVSAAAEYASSAADA
ncbi:cobyrinate a,c-diamide synthase [Nocardia aurantia]|uniref:Hydrogenobyrinate a,c-diamide synthase n=1 Tax=Nocardia aurantia TaxID=2585199 RepID=A0A7K0DY58_9NOCA|nr:cobyrinate a,c-diamide synthase [Nocardia aurantia]MQY30733.1 Cobyrinate a,c-diamide synthase [Nocardia aurantia]